MNNTLSSSGGELAADDNVKSSLNLIEEGKKSTAAARNEFGTTQVIEEGFTSMGAPYDLDDDLYNKTNWMVEYALIDGHQVPRFGLFSLLLESTPVFLYKNKVMDGISRTAFTDGIHIFIHADFYEKLRDEYAESGGQLKGPMLLIMHELFHKMLRHIERHAHFDPMIANLGEDLSINTRIQMAFPQMEWPQTLREVGVGFGPGESVKYSGMSEDEIILELMERMSKDLKQPKQPPMPGQGKGQKGQGGGGGGQPKPDGDVEDGAQEPQATPGPGQKQKSSQGQSGQEQSGQETNEARPDRFGDIGDNHHVNPQELLQKLKDAGMDETMRRLGLPDPDDQEAVERLKNDAENLRVEAISKAADQMAKAKGQYPGADIVSYASDMIRAQVRGRMRWKLAFRSAFYNSALKTRFSDDDDPDDIFHVDEVTKILGSNLFIGSDVPDSPESIVIGIIDISGSMGNPDVVDGATELFSLQRSSSGFSDSASEVLIVMGDTQLRGDVIPLNEQTFNKLAKEGFQRPTAGGTDLGQLMRSTLALPQVKEKNVRAIVFITDTYDRAPKFEEIGLKDRSTAIVYAIVPSAGAGNADAFALETNDYARTVIIDDNVQVDLTENFRERMAALPSQGRAAAIRRRLSP